eukprot:scaffold7264_cov22-Tisochrysis_lutea.AAC.1
MGTTRHETQDKRFSHISTSDIGVERRLVMRSNNACAFGAGARHSLLSIQPTAEAVASREGEGQGQVDVAQASSLSSPTTMSPRSQTCVACPRSSSEKCGAWRSTCYA